MMSASPACPSARGVTFNARALQDCLALAAIFVTTDSVAVLQVRLT